MTWFKRTRRRQWHPTPVLLPGKSYGRRGLVGCSPWGRWESDMTERLHFIFSLSCIGDGNGNPLQCSCLETPRDWGPWWAAVSGVAQSQTRLKRLSSSSSSSSKRTNIICPHLYKVPRVVKYTETESRIMVTGACWGEGMRSYCLMSIGFQFGIMKQSGDGCGNGCAIMSVYSMSLNRTLKM